MNDEITARNFGARPGYKLYDDIGLPGWDERSVWGYDEGVGSFYAQLWRNPGDSDAPDVWLSGVDPCYPWPDCLVLAVLDATGCDPVSVVRALGLTNPGATLRPLPRIEDEIRAGRAQAGDGYSDGRLGALSWVRGAEHTAPGSGWSWRQGQPPTPEQVTAEQYLVTGRVYQPLDPNTGAWMGGADEALAWALGGD